MGGVEFTFDHWYFNDLPGDPDERVISRQVEGAAWSSVGPTVTAGPTLIAHSPEVAANLGLDAEAVASEQFARVFSGNELLPGMQPFAMNYGGHQFGNWAGQLGDGRAIALGEITTPDGGHQTLQLKGAGPTPYSRSADGRAVLRSSIREFLCSEAMHHLGVPTTRGLSLALTGDAVMRDVLYDGHPADEQGAVVCRVAPSFIRFGHFELPTSRGEVDLLRNLVEHTIRRHFPDLVPESADPQAPLDNDVIMVWFQDVVDRTADLMVDWMRVGFVHGVMNTDNLSILGLTIDYGPYGWLENYDPDWTPNTTDAGGRRYRYGYQPRIGLWNLIRLGSAVHQLVGVVEPLQDMLDGYTRRYERKWNAALAAKLGLNMADADAANKLGADLLELLPIIETDMTIFFRTLGDIDVSAVDSELEDEALVAPLVPAYYRPEELSGEALVSTANWFREYIALSATVDRSPEERRTAMHAVNPKYVLRNYLAQMAIDKADVGEYSMIEELLDLLRNPYDDQPGREEYASRRPDWARERVGCSMLSCSS
jgi:uncharacterized protein YdiU (UPF0061 family)